MLDNSASLIELATSALNLGVSHIVSTIISHEEAEDRVGLGSTCWGNYFLVTHNTTVYVLIFTLYSYNSVRWFPFGVSG